MTSATRPTDLLKLAVLAGLAFLTIAILPPTLDELIRQPFGLDNRGLRAVMILHSLPQLLFAGLLFGLWSDRIGRRVPLIMLGLVGSGFTTAMLPWAPTMGVLLTIRLFDGLFSILAVGLLMTRLIDLVGRSARRTVFGLVMMAVPLGFLGGSLLIRVLEPYGMEAIFGAAGGLLVLGALWMVPDLRRPEEVTALAPGPREMLAAIKRLPHLWLPCMFHFADRFSFAAIALLTAAFVRDRFGIVDSATTAATILAFFWFGYMVFSPLSGWLTTRLGTVPLIAWGSLLYGAGLLAIGFAPSVTVFGILMAVCGALTAVQAVPSIVLVGEQALESERATAVETYQLVGSWGMMLGFALMGTMSVAQGYRVAYGLSGVLEIACAVVGFAVVAWGWSRPRQVVEPETRVAATTLP